MEQRGINWYISQKFVHATWIDEASIDIFAQKFALHYLEVYQK